MEEGNLLSNPWDRPKENSKSRLHIYVSKDIRYVQFLTENFHNLSSPAVKLVSRQMPNCMTQQKFNLRIITTEENLVKIKVLCSLHFCFIWLVKIAHRKLEEVTTQHRAIKLLLSICLIALHATCMKFVS